MNNSNDRPIMSTSGGKYRTFVIESICLAVLALAVLGAFLVKAETLFTGFDGGYMRELARRQLSLGMPLSHFGPDFLMGLGDLFFTTNFRLFPAYLAGSMFGTGDLSKAVTYTVCFAELAFSVYLLGRRLALPKIAARVAGLALPLLSLPLFESAALYPIYALVPQMATSVAVTTLMGWAYLGIGRGSAVRSAAESGVFLGGLLFLVFGAVVVFVIALPVMVVYAAAGFVAASGRRERWFKAAALAAGGAIMLAGPASFLLGLALDTAPAFFGGELESGRATLLFSTMLFHGALITAAGPALAGLGIVGAILALAASREPRGRAMAGGILIFLALLIGFWLATLRSDWWSGPSPLYFEFYAAPIYAVFAASALVRAARWGARWGVRWGARWGARFLPVRPACGPWAARCGVLLAAGVVALGFAVFTKTPRNVSPYPPSPTALTEALARDLALAPGRDFRGRVATLTGQNLEGPVDWVALYHNDLSAGSKFGNDHRMVGLTHFGIPTLFQYTSSLSPGIYAVVSRLLARPGDRQTRSTLTMRLYRPRILAMLGVAAVITDAPLPGAEKIAEIERDGTILRAYRVPDPNLGTYSPTRAVSGQSAAAILAAMSASDFDPRAVVFADVPETAFAPVTAARLRVVRDGFAVEAESAGRALLLLPVEYSSCLKAVARSGAPRLVRANLVLTGVVFEGRLDMTLIHRHGPFTQPRCRLDDREAFRALGVSEIPPLPGG